MLQLGKGHCPVVRLGLPEEPGTGVPWGIGSVEQPAPVGLVSQEDPYGFTHSPSQMADGRVDGDDQIELRNQSGGIGEIVEIIGPVYQFHILGRGLGLERWFTQLKAEEPDAGDLSQRAKIGQGQRAMPILLVGRLPGPDQPHAQ